METKEWRIVIVPIEIEVEITKEGDTGEVISIAVLGTPTVNAKDIQDVVLHDKSRFQ